MSIFAKLKYLLLPSHRRALERDMNEELESLRAIAQAEGTRPELGSLAMAAEDTGARPFGLVITQYHKPVIPGG